MKNLVLRSISGIIYSALIISAALYSDLSYIILIFIFSSFTLYEFQKLIEYKSPVPFILFSIIIYQFYNQKLNPYLHLSLLAFSTSISILLIFFLFSNKKIKIKPLQKTALTLFYPVSSCYFIIATSSLKSNIENGISISLFMMVWVNNTFAYIVGKLIGKKNLFPSISPKKTWEGMLGGGFLCFLSSFLLVQFHPGYPKWTFPLLSLIIVGTSTTGDLIQSKFKRLALKKDSGILIPGHGGFYDRMDSVLFSAPFVFLFLMLLNYVS